MRSVLISHFQTPQFSKWPLFNVFSYQNPIYIPHFIVSIILAVFHKSLKVRCMTCQGQHLSQIQIAHFLMRTLGNGLGKLYATGWEDLAISL